MSNDNKPLWVWVGYAILGFAIGHAFSFPNLLVAFALMVAVATMVYCVRTILWLRRASERAKADYDRVDELLRLMDEQRGFGDS